MARLTAGFFLLCLTAGVSAAEAELWTRFRGPNGSGVSRDIGFPVNFNKETNVLWRTPVRPGKSSPVLTRHHIFLTAADHGKLYTLCFDRKTGKQLWERSIDRPRSSQRTESRSRHHAGHRRRKRLRVLQ